MPTKPPQEVAHIAGCAVRLTPIPQKIFSQVVLVDSLSHPSQTDAA
jgi:hypothetical protein